MHLFVLCAVSLQYNVSFFLLQTKQIKQVEEELAKIEHEMTQYGVGSVY